MLTYGGFLLLGGRLGDYFGHRRLLPQGIACHRRVLVCGFANSQWMLLTARAVQGLGGAVVSAIALSLNRRPIHRGGGLRAKAMGVSGSSPRRAATASACSPAYADERHLSWHWVFLVTPIGHRGCTRCAAV